MSIYSAEEEEYVKKGGVATDLSLKEAGYCKLFFWSYTYVEEDDVCFNSCTLYILRSGMIM